MTGYILIYFSFGVALAIFIERWASNPSHRVFMILMSLCAGSLACMHYMYDERWLEAKIMITMDNILTRLVNRMPEYDLEQIADVTPGEPIGDK